MLKNILSLKGAQELSNTEKKNIQGEGLQRGGINNFCSSICGNASYGTICTIHAACPNEGACDGDGGWFYL